MLAAANQTLQLQKLLRASETQPPAGGFVTGT